MNGEFYYREKWPKEFRITIENEDEFKLLQLIFQESPRGILKRYKLSEMGLIGKNSDWKKFVSYKSDHAEEYEAYSTYGVFEAFEEEEQNMKVLEDAGNV